MVADAQKSIVYAANVPVKALSKTQPIIVVIPKSDSSEWQTRAAIGTTLGGTASALALLIAAFSLYRSRKDSAFNRVAAILTEMLKTHDAIVATDPERSRQFLRQFYIAYEATTKVEPSMTVWSTDTRIDIAYTFTFYGPTTEADLALAAYGPPNVKAVHDRLKNIQREGDAKGETMLKGFQASLSQYMRNLFSMYMLVEDARLGGRRGRDLGKIVRSKLSNYDQALLSLNIISHLGREWRDRGLVERFKPFANVPETFLSFDPNFKLKDRFPEVDFEWERRTRSASKVWRKKLGRLHIAWFGKAAV